MEMVTSTSVKMTQAPVALITHTVELVLHVYANHGELCSGGSRCDTSRGAEGSHAPEAHIMKASYKSLPQVGYVAFGMFGRVGLEQAGTEALTSICL